MLATSSSLSKPHYQKCMILRVTHSMDFYLTISQHIYREYPKSPSSHTVLHSLHPTTPRPLYDAYDRQHNGEIAQGASKTKHHRPWVMQMIVHGFPSRLVGTPSYSRHTVLQQSTRPIIIRPHYNSNGHGNIPINHGIYGTRTATHSLVALRSQGASKPTSSASSS